MRRCATGRGNATPRSTATRLPPAAAQATRAIPTHFDAMVARVCAQPPSQRLSGPRKTVAPQQEQAPASGGTLN